MTEAVGWASSFVLVLTLVQQVVTQWRSKTTEGVSPLLYAGQVAASAGFVVYSALVRNWVFVVTNGILTVSALVGVAIYWHQRAGGHKRR